MDASELEQALRTTLEDERMTRSERSALKEALRQRRPTESELAKLRHLAFDWAREGLGPQNAWLDWLESVTKLLASKPEQAEMAEAHFSPGGTCGSRIRELLSDAEASVDICVFTITDNRIADAILETHRRGVDVRIISDNDKSEDRGSDVDRLASAGIQAVFDRTEHHMHHKFAVFDRRILLTGSYNWTRSASAYNHENLVVTDDPRLVRAFLKTFEALWKQLS